MKCVHEIKKRNETKISEIANEIKQKFVCDEEKNSLCTKLPKIIYKNHLKIILDLHSRS